MATKTINVMSLNIWGLPAMFKRTHKKERLKGIAEALRTNKGDFDVVCLQEVWCQEDYEYLLENACETFNYSNHFQSGVNGSGLCIFSKWPIIDVFYFQWSLNGYFHMIHHADWFGGKGIALARINFQGSIVNVYTAHLHAQYDRYNDKYLAHRVIQAFDSGLFIHMTKGDADLSILAGDLNAEPDGLCYDLILHRANLSETYTAGKSYESQQGTNECARNSFSSPEFLKELENKGQRIDHILFRPGKGIKATARSYGFPWPSRIPGTNMSYSDHEAINSVIEFEPTREEPNSTENEGYKVFVQASEVLVDAINSLNKSFKIYSGLFFLMTFIIFLLTSLALEGFLSVVPKIVLFFMFSILNAVSLYLLFMATVWDKLERNSLSAAKKRLDYAKKAT